MSVGAKHRAALVPFYELFTAPAAQILDRWFESDVLKVTLATDAVIGALSDGSNDWGRSSSVATASID